MDISHDSALDPRRILTYSFWFNSTSQSKTWTPVLFKGNSSGKEPMLSGSTVAKKEFIRLPWMHLVNTMRIHLIISGPITNGIQ